MKKHTLASIALLAAFAGSALAQPEAPLSTVFTYQGQLRNNGTPVSSNADFRFTLWDLPAGGVQVGATTTRLNVPVSANGLFTATINPGVGALNGEDRYLQIEVRNPAGVGGYVLVPGRQLITAAPYALQTRGLFTDNALNVGVGTTTPAYKLDVNGSIRTNGQLQVDPNTLPVLVTGMNNVAEKRMWLSHSNSFPAWGIQYRDFTSDGFPGDAIEFTAGNSANPLLNFFLFTGELSLYDGSGNALNNSVMLDAISGSGGELRLRQPNGLDGVRLDGAFSGSTGGSLQLLDSTGAVNINLNADGGGLGGGPSAGIAILKNGSNADGMRLQTNNGNGGSIILYNSAGVNRLNLRGDLNGGGYGIMYQNNGAAGVDIRGSETSTTGGQILVYRSDGVATIEIDGDFNGNGRIITQEMQITGGSDLSENFDVADDAQPGMVVSIDPDSPGRLMVCSTPMDKKVAGVVSGAGGVRPGLLMGQKGTIADGAQPVALTGRVYCWVDASYGAIEPGDFVTTSATPGHAMKAADLGAAQGAILGKAMTRLESGKGLVLILVNMH